MDRPMLTPRSPRMQAMTPTRAAWMLRRGPTVARVGFPAWFAWSMPRCFVATWPAPAAPLRGRAGWWRWRCWVSGCCDVEAGDAARTVDDARGDLGSALRTDSSRSGARCPDAPDLSLSRVA